jgi:hypothetical protein
VTRRPRVAVVIAIAVTSVVLCACGSSAPSTTTPTTLPSAAFVPTPTSIVHEVLNVPMSVFNTVGVTSPQIQLASLYESSGLSPLDWKVAGVARPTVYYFGAEFCPFCAAFRWSLIVALSRFGTFSHLGDTQSSAIDEYPNTQTFTLWKATYTSQFINLFTIESYTNIPSGDFYVPLQSPTSVESAEVKTYDNPDFISGLPQGGSIPFVTFNNRYFVVGGTPLPKYLAGLTRAQIAGHLTNTSNAVTEAIIGTANLISAAVCKIDAQQPTTVCQSSGVRAADHALGITP